LRQGESGYDVTRLFDALAARPPEAVVKAAMNRWGKVSILINNCGGPKAGTFESFNDSDCEDAFQATFMCYVRAIRACIPFFRQQKYGRIVNIASGSTKTALTNWFFPIR
jgi:3-oxoacyl-[acyl-carrier protein] reductase